MNENNALIWGSAEIFQGMQKKCILEKISLPFPLASSDEPFKKWRTYLAYGVTSRTPQLPPSITQLSHLLIT